MTEDALLDLTADAGRMQGSIRKSVMFRQRKMKIL